MDFPFILRFNRELKYYPKMTKKGKILFLLEVQIISGEFKKQHLDIHTAINSSHHSVLVMEFLVQKGPHIKLINQNALLACYVLHDLTYVVFPGATHCMFLN